MRVSGGFSGFAAPGRAVRASGSRPVSRKQTARPGKPAGRRKRPDRSPKELRSARGRVYEKRGIQGKPVYRPGYSSTRGFVGSMQAKSSAATTSIAAMTKSGTL